MKITTLIEAGKPVYQNLEATNFAELAELVERIAPSAAAAAKADRKKRIYRGIRDNHNSVFIQHTDQSVRTSENTANHVTNATSFLDSWSGLPARSAGVSCTSSSGMAVDYGTSYIALPADDAVVVYCGDDDFWTAFPALRELDMDVSDVNEKLNQIYQALQTIPQCPKNISTAAGLKQFFAFIDASVATGAMDRLRALEYNKLTNAFLESDDDTFVGFMSRLLAPVLMKKRTGTTLESVNTIEEIFVSGTILFIQEKIWDGLVQSGVGH